MSTPDVFKRVERKYLLTPRQFEQLTTRLSSKIYLDGYGRSTISSLYYDTPEFAMISRSIEKPLYKEKLRIRAYNSPASGDPVYAELKKKFKGIVYKRRVAMTSMAAYAFMGGTPYLEAVEAFPLSDPRLQKSCFTPKHLQIAEEIRQCSLRWNEPKPAMMVCVEREAYKCVEGDDLRVTFDFDPRWRATKLFFNAGKSGKLMYSDERIIMEIKCLNAYPRWLVDTLNDLQIYPQPNSKYGHGFMELRSIQQHTPQRRLARKPESRVAAFAV